MAKKARQRISYVLDNPKSSAGGHALGVNGLAVDRTNNILYSGGRDGIVCAWDLNLDLSGTSGAATDHEANKPPKTTTTLRAQTQAHMHWINDIALAQHNSALVTASSDLTVKVWRPYSEEPNAQPQSIGEHADYVKCLATPPADMGANWVASGGLDRKLCIWDLNGGGKTLEIDVKGEEKDEKGSVYSLCVGRNIMACGGPEKAVRLYDVRSGERVSKLVGHLKNIRSILIDEAGDRILSASADKTIKMWSVRGGRCMYTFTMHEESVWSLYSDDPRLSTFYSGDRSGIVAKTDVRGSIDDMDDGLSLAVVQEHSSINKVVAAGGNIWTATPQSSINRWEDIDMNDGINLPEPFKRDRSASTTSAKHPQAATNGEAPKKRDVPPSSVLRISNTASFPSRGIIDPETLTLGEQARKSSVVEEPLELDIKPIHQLPIETIEGQCGLLKHKMLNDRRHVLTLDTAGEVLMWDLITCKPIQSFGKQHMEDVEVTVNTREAVAPWCSCDLSSGNLTVVLEPFNLFDAEVYADELVLDEPVEFREDQRISLGRWILRYLFADLIDEEIKRDEVYRQTLNDDIEKRQAAIHAAAPTSIEIPQTTLNSWPLPDSATTPKANGIQFPPQTPGMAIGQATPGQIPPLPGLPEGTAAHSPMSPLEKRASYQSRPSGEDYFTSTIGPADGNKPAASPATPAAEPDNTADKNKEKEKAGDNAKSPTTPFGKKFKMSFGTKKLGRSASQATQDKPAVVDEKTEEESESSSSHEKEVEDSFLGAVQKIRNEYDRQIIDSPNKIVETRVTPSLASETPVLKLPPATKVILQEETSGGNTNLYQGIVGTLGRDADTIERKAPMWLGDLLLQNQIPWKEPVKVSFVLHPMDDLPTIATADGNNRLNANRMLRVKKILSYIAERIEPVPEEPEPDALRPEEYLELYCNDQILDPLMTLATLRTHIWKGGNDIILHYKANGRKEIRPAPPPPPLAETTTEDATQQDAATTSEAPPTNTA